MGADSFWCGPDAYNIDAYLFWGGFDSLINAAMFC